MNCTWMLTRNTAVASKHVEKSVQADLEIPDPAPSVADDAVKPKDADVDSPVVLPEVPEDGPGDDGPKPVAKPGKK